MWLKDFAELLKWLGSIGAKPVLIAFITPLVILGLASVFQVATWLAMPLVGLTLLFLFVGGLIWLVVIGLSIMVLLITTLILSLERA